MSKCDFCGKEIILPFQCQYCNAYFCKEHRLPENHKCVGLELKKPIFRYSRPQKIRKDETLKEVKAPAISIKEKHSEKTTHKRKIGIVVGLILIGILVPLTFAFVISPIMEGVEKPTFDIHQEITKLQGERPSWDQYPILEYNWKVWKKQWEASGGTLIKMDSWDEFKESLRQNSFVDLLMLDGENKVIWYKPTSTAVVYYPY